MKRGSPERIHIVEFELGCDNYPHLKDIIYGSHDNTKYDGIHLIGNSAMRHFTYRAVQAISPIVTQPSKFGRRKFAAHNGESYIGRAKCGLQDAPNHAGNIGRAKFGLKDNYHTNCEQAKYQRQSSSYRGSEQSSRKTYAEAAQNTESRYNVPTKNYFNPLNC